MIKFKNDFQNELLEELLKDGQIENIGEMFYYYSRHNVNNRIEYFIEQVKKEHKVEIIMGKRGGYTKATLKLIQNDEG